MNLSRRRFLTISAAALTGTTRAHATEIQRRRFVALGAEAHITLPGAAELADRTVAAISAETALIEAAFSLWNPASELSRLNRDSVLPKPSDLFRDLAAQAQEMSRRTEGAFDVTIQPMWDSLRLNRITSGTVDYRRMIIEQTDARFSAPGMGASFNGIAQGFATDRAVAILEEHGYRDLLANLGEYHGKGQHPEGRNWNVGVADPKTGRIAAVLDPAQGAIATSEPGGTLVGGQSHIFDPLNRPGPRWTSVTVQARDATTADALSTAIAASPTEATETLLHAGGAWRAVLIHANQPAVLWAAS